MSSKEYQHYQPMHMTLHERAFPHPIREGIWMWSVFSEEKEIDFNGYLIQTGDQASFIIDPPCAGHEVLDAFTPLPKPQFILLTNRDHERAAEDFRRHFNIPVYASDMDAPLMALSPDQTYHDGECFPGGWQAIHLECQKSPGECALYNLESRILILGDALIGKPFQQVSMLPADKYHDKREAIQGLQRLKKLDVTMILPCDGEPVLKDGSAHIADALQNASQELER